MGAGDRNRAWRLEDNEHASERRRAARLPKDALLPAELMEAAEYYASGPDQAATVTRVTRRDALDLGDRRLTLGQQPAA